MSTSYEAVDISCFKIVGGEVWTRMLFLSGDTDIFVKAWCVRGFEHGFHGCFLRTWIFLVLPWCVGVLNTDCTDYTDCFVDAWCVGFWTRITRIIFLRTWIILVNAWCVGLLNTDFTDYTDVFIGGRQDWRLWSHCEEAQDYPWNPCNPCSTKKTSVVTPWRKANLIRGVLVWGGIWWKIEGGNIWR